MRFVATETQRRSSALLAACDRAGYSEADVINLLANRVIELEYEVTRLLVIQSPPIVIGSLPARDT